MLQNPSLLLTHSINGDGCVFNNRLRNVVSRNLIAVILCKVCLGLADLVFLRVINGISVSAWVS